MTNLRAALCASIFLLSATQSLYAQGGCEEFFEQYEIVPGTVQRFEFIDMSADGRYVCYQEEGADRFVGIWDRELGTFSRLKDLETPVTLEGISGDGSTLFGTKTVPIPSRGGSVTTVAARWDAATGAVTFLDTLEAGDTFSVATACSHDGSTIVGVRFRDDGGTEAFLWPSDSGLVLLGDFEGGPLASVPLDVSDDGAIVVGRGRDEVGLKAFRWTADEGMISLGDLPGGEVRSAAGAISGDGLVIAGLSAGANDDSEPFIWREETGMQGLGPLVIDDVVIHEGFISALNYDGSAAGGSAGGTIGTFWTEQTGFISIKEYVQNELGIDTTPLLNLGFVRSISDDGSQMIGAGFPPSFTTINWIFQICEGAQAADLNADTRVDSEDLAILLAAWGGPSADLDNDGSTGSSDLAILLAAWTG